MLVGHTNYLKCILPKLLKWSLKILTTKMKNSICFRFGFKRGDIARFLKREKFEHRMHIFEQK
jgi:hypothetical protein